MIPHSMLYSQVNSRFLKSNQLLTIKQFQYVSLIRFGSKTYEKARRLGTALQRWEDKKSDIVRSLSNLTSLRE